MSEEASPLDRVRRIEAETARSSAWVTLLAVIWALALATAFLLGHAYGPTPLRALEAALAYSGLLLIALAVARPVARRRILRDARAQWSLFEGQTRRSVLVFDDHVRIDGEIVLGDTVDTVRREGDSLLLRYQDPVAGGPLLREWTGSGRALDAVADALRPGREEGQRT